MSPDPDADDTGWGVAPSRQQPVRPPARVDAVEAAELDLGTKAAPAAPAKQTLPFRSDDTPARPVDVPGVAAVLVGVVGVFVLGIVAAIVAAILAAESGRRAREAERSPRLALWAFGLAVVDAVLWLVVQSVFQPSFLVG